jgi:transaldolase
MPQATLKAFADHGDATGVIDLDAGDAERVLRDAAAAGIDLSAITGQLEHEGVQGFCDSYGDLLRCIETKLAGIATSVDQPEAPA